MSDPMNAMGPMTAEQSVRYVWACIDVLAEEHAFEAIKSWVGEDEMRLEGLAEALGLELPEDDDDA